MARTEFYDSAVRLGFYGTDKGGLTGKRDYVRTFWEDMSIKLTIRPHVEALKQRRGKLRVADLGCGSGEGVDLLTHIPVADALATVDRSFTLARGDFETYVGLDISPEMVAQGARNHADWPAARFILGDLSKGFALSAEPPFDLYFSSYASPSHVRPAALERLLSDIADHAANGAVVALDLMGRRSPEWPEYWRENAPSMLPYHMGYLFDGAPIDAPTSDAETYKVCYWTGGEVEALVDRVAKSRRRTMRLVELRDRSILVGRHMQTGAFNARPLAYRLEINRLFHPDHRGNLDTLHASLPFLDEVRDAAPEAWTRIDEYRRAWNTVVATVEALMRSDAPRVRQEIEAAEPNLAEELKMLAWLYRNAARFPVVDFWASIMGPQVACVLRNLELSLPRGLGCGHGLMAVIEIDRR